MKEKILNLLANNARITFAEIAERLYVDEKQIEDSIHEMEKQGIIRGYTVILNDESIRKNQVRALIEVSVIPERDGGFDYVARRISKFSEVTDVYLVSGNYDLRVEVKGESLQDVAAFVHSKLATIEGVKSTATIFLLKKYKEAGKIMDGEESYERLKVTP
jgi:DNA-binding Lrp family transcriptional regulator